MPCPSNHSRRGAVLVLSALLMVVMFGMAAFAIDIGYMMLLRTQLQVAADAGAMAAGNVFYLTPAEIRAVGRDYAAHQRAGGRKVENAEAIVDLGTWNSETATFTTSAKVGNAVRVTVYREHESLFFGRVLNHSEFRVEASAIAMANPRDIAFVVDLSGSMNDDTEPAWATPSIASKFSSTGFGGVGDELMQDVFTDFGYGAFPGKLEHIGAPLGVPADQFAYARLSSDMGPLASPAQPPQYRLLAGDDEATRKAKTYRWIIEQQLARVMPAAQPACSYSNYSYWEKYLDYVLDSVYIMPPPPPAPPAPPSSPGPSPPPGPPSPPPPPPPPTPPLGRRGGSQLNWLALLEPQAALTGMMQYTPSADPGTPPLERGWIPSNQDGDRIYQFNNPNRETFPSADGGLPRSYLNKVGYLTYTQFMMDHGRDLHPDDASLVPLAIDSGRCPWHTEATAGGSFRFPPREQPMHACRRSLIAALATIQDRNNAIADLNIRDQVTVITFDSLTGGNAPEIKQSLTGDYKTAMLTCTKLQALGDKGMSTATEAGLELAAQYLRPQSQGGKGRKGAEKIVVLLTDGVPNAYTSSNSEINSHVSSNPSSEYYGGGYYWLDAALMQASMMKQSKFDMYPVGIGLGTDYGFMDRAARLGGTAGKSGGSPRGSGNPAEYEQVLTDIFKKIVMSPSARLVQ